MTPECGTTAYLDMTHNLLLFIGYTVSTPVLLAVDTKNIGHFRLLPLPLESGFCAYLFHRSAPLVFVENVKRTFDFSDSLLNEVKVDQGSLQG
jgi:hypothetical protein